MSHKPENQHQFKIDLDTNAKEYVTVNMYSQATLDDVLSAFTGFLKAVGYSIPEDSFLDFIKEDYKNDYDTNNTHHAN
jgi:hypothetical protein